MKLRSLIAPLTVALLALLSCQTVSPNDEIEVLGEYAELQAMFDAEPNNTWVVNFWATSCPPCLKEMPHFRELKDAYVNSDIKILLVSLDKAEDLDKRVYPFVAKHNITPEVVVLGDQNYSAWTDEVDPSWYGALPATMIFNKSAKAFKFGAYASAKEIESDVVKVMAE